MCKLLFATNSWKNFSTKLYSDFNVYNMPIEEISNFTSSYLKELA